MKNHVLTLLSFLALGLVSTACSAQEDKSARPSPPAVAEATIDGGAKVSVHYSSPSVKGRSVWGDLVPYNKVWRTGANEATKFKVDRDVTINGQSLAAGKYGLFTIPGDTEWTFVFNSVYDQWGAYKYDDSKDVLRVKAAPMPAPAFQEKMTFDIKDNIVTLHWENLIVGFEVKEASQ
jgi:hypothetical protein